MAVDFLGQEANGVLVGDVLDHEGGAGVVGEHLRVYGEVQLLGVTPLIV